METSIPFSVGQIVGYAGDAPGQTFWKRYAPYTAVAMVSSVVWVQRAAPDHTVEMMARVQRVLEEHNDFECARPTWFV